MRCSTQDPRNVCSSRIDSQLSPEPSRFVCSASRFVSASFIRRSGFKRELSSAAAFLFCLTSSPRHYPGGRYHRGCLHHYHQLPRDRHCDLGWCSSRCGHPKRLHHPQHFRDHRLHQMCCSSRIVRSGICSQFPTAAFFSSTCLVGHSIGSSCSRTVGAWCSPKLS